GQHLFNLNVSRTTDTRRNQGLEGGYDLPARGFDSSSTDDVGQLSWTKIGAHFVHDARVEVSRGVSASSARQTGPAILVFDAFNTGGNQDAATRTLTNGLQAL